MEEQIQYVQGQTKIKNIEQNVPNDLMAEFSISPILESLKSFRYS